MYDYVPDGYLDRGIPAVSTDVKAVIFMMVVSNGLCVVFDTLPVKALIEAGPVPLAHAAIAVNYSKTHICPAIDKMLTTVEAHMQASTMEQVAGNAKLIINACVCRFRLWAMDVSLAAAYKDLNTRNTQYVGDNVEEIHPDLKVIAQRELQQKLAVQSKMDVRFNAVFEQLAAHDIWHQILMQFGNIDDIAPAYRELAPWWLKPQKET